MFIMTAFDIIIICQACTRDEGFTMLTYTFGFLGPMVVIHWTTLLAFLVTGWNAMFRTTHNYHVAAKRFRVWCRVSRLFAVTWFTSTATFLFNCFMFSKGISFTHNMSDILDQYARQRGTRYWYERDARSFGNVMDFVAYSNPGMSLKFPFDYFYFCGGTLGVSLPFMLIIPFAYILSCLWGQGKYYRWRFFQNTRVPIE